MNNPCDRCYLSIRNQCTAGRGVVGMPAAPSFIMFVSEAPGIVDFKTNIIFNGRFTKLVNTFIIDYELSRYSVKTNLIKCVTSEINEYYADKCYPFFIKELNKYKPKIIVAIGSFVYKFLKNENKCNMRYIVNRPVRFNNSILLPIYDPAYIIYNKVYDEYVKSFELISELLKHFCKDYQRYRIE